MPQAAERFRNAQRSALLPAPNYAKDRMPGGKIRQTTRAAIFRDGSNPLSTRLAMTRHAVFLACGPAQAQRNIFAAPAVAGESCFPDRTTGVMITAS